MLDFKKFRYWIDWSIYWPILDVNLISRCPLGNVSKLCKPDSKPDSNSELYITTVFILTNLGRICQDFCNTVCQQFFLLPKWNIYNLNDVLVHYTHTRMQSKTLTRCCFFFENAIINSSRRTASICMFYVVYLQKKFQSLNLIVTIEQYALPMSCRSELIASDP